MWQIFSPGSLFTPFTKKTALRWMRRLRPFLTVAFACVLLLGAAWLLVGRSQQASQRAPPRFGGNAPVPVLAEQATIGDVPKYLDGVGTVRALNMVTIRSQVDGTIVRINFREGQDVKAGDVLAQIDPRTYQAQLDQTVAKKALDEAQLSNAKVDLERYANLVKATAVARQQYDTQRAVVAQFEAQVKLDEGAIDNAKTLLEYCTIVSPLDGRLGVRLIDEGNLVRAAAATGIVVITQIQPIAVIFTLPQQQLPQVNEAFNKESLAADALDAVTKTVLGRGKLVVVNNQIDQTTGTVQLKAEFPNPDLRLWPGQFVTVRLLIDTLRDVVTVPAAAVQQGPSGTFVYVLQNDSTVAVRSVAVRQRDESRTVISEGIAPSDRVITSGFAQLSAGRKVAAAGSDGSSPAPSGRKDSESVRSDRGQPGRNGREDKSRATQGAASSVP
jgi:multidrug efflux system membrane fusion protein